MDASGVVDFVDRYLGSARRRVQRLPGVSTVRAIHRRHAQRHHAGRLGLLPPPVAEIAEAVRRDGIWIGPFDGADGTLFPGLDLSLAAAALDQSAPGAPERPTFHLAKDDERTLPVYLSGLRSALMAVSEHYFSLPARYLGAEIKRERAVPFSGQTRQWHRDVEDDQVLKALIYLNPVGEGGGPLEYLSRAGSDRVATMLGYRSGFVSDDQTAAAAAPDRPVEAHGAAGTLVLFDGARLFHRAQVPRRRDRDSITFTYVSCLPRQVYRFQRPSRKLRALAEGIA